MKPASVLMRRASGPAAPWTPANLTLPPKIWLNESSSVTNVSGNASAYSNVGSMGASGDFAQITSTNRPLIVASGLNGMRTLRFDGLDNFMSATSAGAKDIFRNVGYGYFGIVAKKLAADGAGTDRVLMSVSRSTNSGVMFRALCGTTGAANVPGMGIRRDAADAGWALAGATNVGTGWRAYLFVMDWTDDDAFLHLDGALDAQNTALTGSSGNTEDAASNVGIFLGAQTNTSNFADIEVAEVIIGSGPSKLNSGDIANWFSYADSKWAI